jgi:multisubunit Na+/H+ antiporter MnhG subunit
MNRMPNAKNMIILGFVLVLAGVVFPFLMTIGLIRSSFVLNFASYGASVAGLLLGIIGTALYSRAGRG